MKPESCPVCHGPLEASVHRQAPLTVEGRHAHVDEGLAELLEAAWFVGIFTLGSCQEMPEDGLAHIVFEAGSAERFVAAASTEPLEDGDFVAQDELGWRMRGADPGPWQWQPGGPAWAVAFAASFPPGDIAELTRRLSKIAWGE